MNIKSGYSMTPLLPPPIVIIIRLSIKTGEYSTITNSQCSYNIVPCTYHSNRLDIHRGFNINTLLIYNINCKM